MRMAAKNASATQPIATATPAIPVFRFLDLPPEISNRIYAYAVQNGNESGTRNLASFNEPAITAVCRQVRFESLPVLFADCTFEVVVGSNLYERLYRRTGSIPRYSWHRAQAGTLGVQRDVTGFVREAKTTAVFRKIHFSVCEADMAHYLRYTKEGRSEVKRFEVGKLELAYASQSLQVVKSHEGIPNRYRDWTEDVVSAIEDAVTRQVAEREGFIGFTIKDLKKIAKGFRFVPQATSNDGGA